ncbi:hypothetical protein [Lysobacter sp. HA18]
MLKRSMKSLATGMMCLAVFSAFAADPIRIDGSTDVRAKASFNHMVDAASPERARELQVAVLLTVMDGVGSAREMLSRPELRSPSIALIKDRVNGMTADELIALSKTSTMKAAPSRP